MENKLGKNKTVTTENPYLFPQWKELFVKIPVFLIVPIVYVVIGMVLHIWHPTWLLFLFIPIHLQMCFAFYAKNFKSFLLRLPIVFFIVLEFLTVGLLFNLWKIAWLGFLIIPLYYWGVAVFVKKERNVNENQNN